MIQYVPFGFNCTPADALKYGNLRKHSLPFDYVFAYATTIKHSLDTDFAEWFQIDKMTPKGVDDHRWTVHSTYGPHSETKNIGFFNHHDMTDPDVQKAFKRRIARYKEIVNSDDHVVFFTNSTPDQIKENDLLNYYNRGAKTSFVYLHKIGSESNYASTRYEGDKIFIDYKSTGRISEEASKMICENLIKIAY